MVAVGLLRDAGVSWGGGWLACRGRMSAQKCLKLSLPCELPKNFPHAQVVPCQSRTLNFVY